MIDRVSIKFVLNGVGAQLVEGSLSLDDRCSGVIQGAPLVFRRTLLKGIMMSRPVRIACSRSPQVLRDVNKSGQ